MKPILFNTEMVRAILDGRKTVTRRPVKLKGYKVVEIDKRYLSPHSVYASIANNNTLRGEWIKKPYINGDILYVKETFAKLAGEYLYKADGKTNVLWKPSVQMPREAARIFLRVTDVRVDRLQNITPSEIRKEGLTFDEKCPVNSWNQFVRLWDSTVKPADSDLYGWDASPWVWVIEFEWISKEEEVK